MATFCAVFALLGFGIELVNGFVAQPSGGKAHSLCVALVILFVAAAVATGVYAQLCQLRRWSRRANRRLWIGFPTAGITFIALLPNFLAVPPVPTISSTKTEQTAHKTTGHAVATDHALVKPGWYGELQQRNLLLVVSSYREDAEESRSFNARLFKPVSYATFSVINLGCPDPVRMEKLEVDVLLNSGKRITSLPIMPLLSQKASANEDLLTHLKLPKTLSTGEMLPDIPICLATDFSWTNVAAVIATVGACEMAIPGRVMTASEKKVFLGRTLTKPSASNTGPSAETWYKGM